MPYSRYCLSPPLLTCDNVPFLPPLPRLSSLRCRPTRQVWSRLLWRHNPSSQSTSLANQRVALSWRCRLTQPLYQRPRPSRRWTFDKVCMVRFDQQELSNIFASFVHIVFFFQLVSCIDMKLEFYATLVFYGLSWFFIQSFWPPWTLVMCLPLSWSVPKWNK